MVVACGGWHVVTLDVGDELDRATRSVVEADRAIRRDLADDQVRHNLTGHEVERGRAVGDDVGRRHKAGGLWCGHGHVQRHGGGTRGHRGAADPGHRDLDSAPGRDRGPDRVGRGTDPSVQQPHRIDGRVVAQFRGRDGDGRRRGRAGSGGVGGGDRKGVARAVGEAGHHRRRRRPVGVGRGPTGTGCHGVAADRAAIDRCRIPADGRLRVAASGRHCTWGARRRGDQPEGHRVHTDLHAGRAGVVVTDMDRDGTAGPGRVGAQARVPLDGLLVDHFGRRSESVPDGVGSIRRRVCRRDVRFDVVHPGRELRGPRRAIGLGRSVGVRPVRKSLEPSRGRGPPVGHGTGEDETVAAGTHDIGAIVHRNRGARHVGVNPVGVNVHSCAAPGLDATTGVLMQPLTATPVHIRKARIAARVRGDLELVPVREPDIVRRDEPRRPDRGRHVHHQRPGTAVGA